MSIAVSKLNSTIRAHWFLLAAAVIVTGNIAVASLDSWSSPELLEAGVLFDLAFLVPALYLWCYRSRGKSVIPRAIALSCLGIWAAGHVVPDEHHQVLSSVSVVRYVGLAVLVVIQLKLAVLIFRATFGNEADTSASVLATAKDGGMPEWAARLMAWEASLWRRAWDAVRRMIGRD
ncbi:MAG: hypothetical protein DDT34_01819 [Firmicutes bacterium]|nr:hypothetical protein [Bacillota bacterium]